MSHTVSTMISEDLYRAYQDLGIVFYAVDESLAHTAVSEIWSLEQKECSVYNVQAQALDIQRAQTMLESDDSCALNVQAEYPPTNIQEVAITDAATSSNINVRTETSQVAPHGEADASSRRQSAVLATREQHALTRSCAYSILYHSDMRLISVAELLDDPHFDRKQQFYLHVNIVQSLDIASAQSWRRDHFVWPPKTTAHLAQLPLSEQQLSETLQGYLDSKFGDTQRILFFAKHTQRLLLAAEERVDQSSDNTSISTWRSLPCLTLPALRDVANNKDGKALLWRQLRRYVQL